MLILSYEIRKGVQDTNKSYVHTRILILMIKRVD